jgi:AraC-like DNA-binding protein
MCQSIPSLYSRLHLFSKLAPLENSNCRVSLIREGDDFRVYNNLVGYPGLEGVHYSEWLQISVLIDIVRKTLEYNWSPAEITFQAQFSPCDSARNHHPNTRFLFGQKSTSITVPASLMSRSLHSGQNDQRRLVGENHKHNYPAASDLDFPTSLKLTLSSYFQEKYPDVNLAAEIANTSVRTLQRRLGQYGLNYSSLVQQARFEVAAEMLSDPSQKILDVAQAVGYSDPSHFARSFRNIAGVSPGEYRRQHYDG